MGPLTSVIRCARKLQDSPACCWWAHSRWEPPRDSPPARILRPFRPHTLKQAKPISVTLIIYNYSTPSDLQILSQAFGEGQDRGLATALSKTKAVGHCSITGALSYDVAFIQMVVTPTGRKITFITSRPHQFDEADPPARQSFDLAIGQFDLNDTDNTKSTGFLYPASKLVIDKQGEFTMIWPAIPGRWSTFSIRRRIALNCLPSFYHCLQRWKIAGGY
jgi:hypothetical protein